MPPERILVIDDEKDLVRLVRETLESENFRVISAYSGEEGLKKASTELPDLILLDIKMPGLNGFQVLENLKIDKATQHIPVVILTTSLLKEDRQRAFRLGAVECLAKSMDISQLGKRIREILKRQTK